MTPERETRIKTVLSHRQPDLTVLMEKVNKAHNLSAILRSCDAVGVMNVHAVAPRRGLPDLEIFEDEEGNTYETVKYGKSHMGTSASAGKWVDVVQHESTAEAFQFLKSKGFKVYATALSDRSVDFREVDYTIPSCILLGSEKFGITDEASSLADEHIIVPMMGMVQSLNVSVAAAVVLFEAQRQRQVKGMYDASRLSEEATQNYIERWGMPIRKSNS